MVLNFDSFRGKFDSYCWFLVEKKCVVYELCDEVGFPDTWVSNNNYLE